MLGDGAPWIWKLGEEMFLGAIQIVDRFHVKQHLSDVAKAIYGPPKELGQPWAKERHAELDAGHIDAIQQALTAHVKQGPEARRCHEYLATNRQCMRYPEFHAQGLCTSAGVLEAGCRAAPNSVAASKTSGRVAPSATTEQPEAYPTILSCTQPIASEPAVGVTCDAMSVSGRDRCHSALVVGVILLGAIGAHAVDVAPRPSAGCSAAAIETGRELQRTLDVNGVKRAYILDVPTDIQPKKPVPLLFDFHGFGHSAAGVWNVSGFKQLAARDGFITVYPDGLPVHLLGRDAPGWEIFKVDANRDLAFTAQLLDHIERTYCIDLARVFSTGFSNGAYFSYLLACRMADRFAAVAPVSGGQVPGACNPGRAVPMLIHHGRQDEVVPVAQARAMRDVWIQRDGCREHVSNTCEEHRQCRDGSEVEYCEGDFAHHWPPEATERIWDFFRAHPMPAKNK